MSPAFRANPSRCPTAAKTYHVDFVVTGTDDRSFMIDVAEESPKPPAGLTSVSGIFTLKCGIARIPRLK
jgi:hypothetical protein